MTYSMFMLGETIPAYQETITLLNLSIYPYFLYFKYNHIQGFINIALLVFLAATMFLGPTLRSTDRMPDRKTLSSQYL